MNRLTALLGTLGCLCLGAGGNDAVDGRYLLSGETVVHAESSLGKYDRTLYPELDATLSHAGAKVVVEVRRDNYVCTLKGSVSGASITLFQGQKCPQSIKGEGFQAELDGTLTAGSGTLGTQKLTLTTSWDVRGRVQLGPISVPVTGTLSTVASGPKS